MNKSEELQYVKSAIDEINSDYLNKSEGCLNCACSIASLLADEMGLECEHCLYREMYEHFSDAETDYLSSCELLTKEGLE